MKRDERKQAIVSMGVKLAESSGGRLDRVYPRDIAEALEFSRNLVVFYFHTTEQLHRALLGEAIRVGSLPVIAQALINNEKRVHRLPDELKRKAIESILNRG